jgi:DNA processing protein
MVEALPDEAYAAALAGLGITPLRLSTLLRQHGPRGALLVAQPAMGDAEVEAKWRAHTDAGITIHLRDQPGYSARLAADHQAPEVLFSRGDLSALNGPLVTIVGTRRCTQTGRDLARQFGRELASAGVGVVSGLAAGIDGAAHEGALAVEGARPVGVVGSGLDVVYPRRHRDLWQAVAERGVLLSEAAAGAPPEPWRFPARNRILAALADVVVVVESHAAGGSMHTVRAAEERGKTIMAVPGSVRSPASAGTNRLLADGLPPALDVDDVLTALGLSRAGQSRGPARLPLREAPSDGDREVLTAVGWEPTSLEDVLRRTGLRPPAAAAALNRLARDGWVQGVGGWWERLGDG